MAPSPTGNLHIGTAYATMWSYLYARHNNGEFILRFEDTDRERSTQEFEENIQNGLSWLSFEWDEGPYHQMDRLEVYQKYVQKLLDEKKAYYCFCTKEELDQEKNEQMAKKEPIVYSGKCRNLSEDEVKQRLDQGDEHTIRFKLDEGRGIIEYNDLLHGNVKVDSKLIGDVIIFRASGVPLYNFAVVVDDIEMKITHVIRGDDHISNTPKQILFFEALDYPLPQFAHFPMILNQDRQGKLSKRTGSTALSEYKKEGFLPEVIFNYLISLGWAPKDGSEIFSKERAIKEFEIKDMNTSAAAWNQEKLEWLNGEYIRAMSDSELTQRLQEFLVDHPAKDRIAEVVPLIKERIKKLSDFIPLTYFFFEKPEYDKSVFESLKVGEDIQKTLDKVIEKLQNLEKPWQATDFEQTFRGLAEELEIPVRDMFQLIRASISGQLVSPPLFESVQLLGEEETLSRVEYVARNFENLPNLKESLETE